MDKNIKRERVSTAPIAIGIHNQTGSTSGLMREIEGWERRLTARHAKLNADVMFAKEEGKKAWTTADMVRAAFKEAFGEIVLEGSLPQLVYGAYLAKKLMLAAKAGMLDPRIDLEYQILKRIMKSL